MTAAKTQPITTPTRMPNRPSSPGPTTVTSRIETSVTVAISGCDSKEPTAVGARLRPISATTAPVTTGGMTASMTRLPIRRTATPININTMPTAMTAPSCAAGPDPADAVSGAMNAKDEPR